MPDSIPASKTDLVSFFGVPDILCQAPQRNHDDVIRTLVYRLAGNHGIADPQAITEAVIAREQATSTVMPHGVAIPHARLSGIERPYVAVATSREGFHFDGHTIYLVLLVLVPMDKPTLYLQTLRSIAGILREDDATQHLAALKTAEEVLRFFQTGGLKLPAYICAADIMTPPGITLRDNASLKAAIDILSDNDIDEVPVVDKEGDLVGVVSASALLNVCLPDYLLWMDDLSPIQNFEPFAEVLRKEHNTWLSEIMSERFAFVQVGSPAIQVAAEFARQNVVQCYVLKARRLMGVITLRTFLHKIFRA
ncbi:MAG: CBS domain-containing protein [Lentisphaerae bacterium]|nr:CBS domain-containing protein [Lentisphaerota bacterium]